MRDDWQSADSTPPLPSGEVQIWRVDLSEFGSKPEIYMPMLAPPEAVRANRFRADQVRLQFIVARACLRALLGQHMDLRPSEVPITLGRFGKPELPPAAGHSLFFNVAHARETILIALCRESGVGVDIEYLDRKTDTLDIARNSFTPREFLHIEQAGTPEEQQKAFFRLWTRKEAVMKADGRGLSIALSAVEVPLCDCAAAAPARVFEGETADAGSRRPEAATWFITDLALGEGIASALAAGRADLRLTTWMFPRDRLRLSV